METRINLYHHFAVPIKDLFMHPKKLRFPGKGPGCSGLCKASFGANYMTTDKHLPFCDYWPTAVAED